MRMFILLKMKIKKIIKNEKHNITIKSIIHYIM